MFVIGGHRLLLVGIWSMVVYAKDYTLNEKVYGFSPQNLIVSLLGSRLREQGRSVRESARNLSLLSTARVSAGKGCAQEFIARSGTRRRSNCRIVVRNRISKYVDFNRSVFRICFVESFESKSLCGNKTLTAGDVQQLVAAIEENYYAELIVGTCWKHFESIAYFFQLSSSVLILRSHFRT